MKKKDTSHVNISYRVRGKQPGIKRGGKIRAQEKKKSANINSGEI